MSIDWSKPVQTRAGRKARVLCTDAKADDGYTVIALVTRANGFEELEEYDAHGHYVIGDSSGRDSDLVNVPQKRWVNIYSDISGWPKAGGSFYESHSDALNAINCRVGKLVATVEVELPVQP